MNHLEYYSCERPEIFPYIPERINKTLDVGCAIGIFSSKLKETRNVETWGIEMEKEAADLAREKLDHVLFGSYDEVCEGLPKHYFDCVFFNDVLEHMTYPEDCLKGIKENISKGGYVVASIPNVRYKRVLKDLLFRKDWKYRDSGVLDRTHFRFFTKKSIIRMFDDCGYKVERIKGINGGSIFGFTSLLNILLLNWLSEVRYKQFVIVASPK